MADDIKLDDTSVRVAVRIRPQLAKERIDMCQVCTAVTPGEPQIVMGKDKAFTFDYVYDMDTTQDKVYATTAQSLIEGTFEGYNATIFAYGQTGSGKTYTMGTGFDVSIPAELVGIIPRAVEHLFNGIKQRQTEAQEQGIPPPDFKVMAQFMELYNEEIHDLLDPTRDAQKGHKSHIKIHEDAGGGIYCIGATTRPVVSLEDTIQCLKLGALSRTTASTNMNAQSSRSHAIFTLHIKQQRVVKNVVNGDGGSENGDVEEPSTEVAPVDNGSLNEFETLTAKFHFVDLAGSERLKRTGATGDRQKEGISINCGLLALGNVISALGDVTKKGTHVPYRDSKLTRLLQDSLGGNSRTVMIACISPSDRDFMETLTTLKYANRTRNIKNKVMINQDKSSKQIALLRIEIQQLQQELNEYKSGKRAVGEDGVETINDMFHENTMLQTENHNLRQRIKALSETADALRTRNAELLAERDAFSISNMAGDEGNEEVKKLIEGYILQIEDLRSKLLESEAMCEQIRRSEKRAVSRLGQSPMGQISSPSVGFGVSTSIDFTLSPTNNANDILAIAKQDIKKLKKKARSRHTSHSDKENVSEEEKQDLEEPEVNERLAEEDGEEADEDEEDDEDDNSDSSDEDSDNIHEDLADLSCEISIKQKLIEELEHSQKRLEAMKMNYEEKMMTLQGRIKETEIERDRVLSNIGQKESATDSKTKKVKEQYEKKLNDMQSELKKLQTAKKEHAKLVRNQAQYEKQLKTLQKDLGEMKKMKVKLLNQMKEDSAKNRQVELRKNKEIAQLKKDQRLKANAMRQLESEKNKKEIVLRRKQEEVESLRKRQKEMSSKAAGRVAKYDKQPTQPVNVFSSQPTRKRKKSEFSAKAAKSKWDTLEKKVSETVVKKQTLSHMERDMEHWIKTRGTTSKKLEKFQRKLGKAEEVKKPPDVIKEYTEQINILKDQITYQQSEINESQKCIMQYEEGKEEEEDLTTVFRDCKSLEEAKYLMEHFLNLVISKGVLAAQKEEENKELLARLHHERMETTYQRDILQYLIQTQEGVEIDESVLKDDDDDDDDDDSDTELNSSCESIPAALDSNEVTAPPSGAIPKQMATSMPPLTTTSIGAVKTEGSSDSLSASTSSIANKKDKVRRKTATPSELLYGGGTTPLLPDPAPSRSLKPVPEVPKVVVKDESGGLVPPSRTGPVKTKANGTTQVKQEKSSPNLGRKRPDPPPIPKKPMPQSAGSSTTSLSKQNSVDATENVTPPTGEIKKSKSSSRIAQALNALRRKSRSLDGSKPDDVIQSVEVDPAREKALAELSACIQKYVKIEVGSDFPQFGRKNIQSESSTNEDSPPHSPTSQRRDFTKRSISNEPMTIEQVGLSTDDEGITFLTPKKKTHGSKPQSPNTKYNPQPKTASMNTPNKTPIGVTPPSSPGAQRRLISKREQTSNVSTKTRSQGSKTPTPSRRRFNSGNPSPPSSPVTQRRYPKSATTTPRPQRKQLHRTGSLSYRDSSSDEERGMTFHDFMESMEGINTVNSSYDSNLDVFKRLTRAESPHPTRGIINPASGRNLKNNALVHTFTAAGHSKAVLSVFATEDLMFSSSKDRTAKVWDLTMGQEILTLDGHPNNVVAVRYCEETGLVYTASTYFIKVWDIREGNKCIRTLMSSGLCQDGAITIDSITRQVTCPPGETMINDIAVNSTGNVLYSAAGSTVRLWDLRSCKAVGKLTGGHQAAVMVLAVDDTDTADGNICVVTGSKDHYIKVFEVFEDSVGIMTPKYNLEPPHYDGIQSLCLMGDLLFSGSRDTCIKKWDLAEQQLQQSINNAHKDWICGLAFMPGGNCLLSGCRGGYIKLWHIDNCTQLGEIKAHLSPINAITTNSTSIFTASNDRTLRMWKPTGALDVSDCSDDE